MYVIDASVFLSGFFNYEPYYEESQKCLDYFKENFSIPIFLPEFVIPEVGCVITRMIKKPKLGIEFAKSLREFLNFKFIPIDRHIADLSLEIGSILYLRGADAIYVAVAYNFNSTLISLDKEHLKKAKKLIRVIHPKDFFIFH
ncbi:type II toxin-antitoxin system VapC family toxin [Patescibacteria group bacterium]|nr:type II toxin-antitoxin system VapC family toxin [Patescibacteria group bacterium]MBU4481289.1 type II toxin-antitoxin system VapC family toxin [Patescibacteria group bacterium]